MFTSVKTEWAYTPTAIVVSCDSQLQARLKVREEYQFWAELASRFGVPKTIIKYPRCNAGFEILASMAEAEEEGVLKMFDGQKIFPVVEFANQLPLSPGILRALETIAENPGDRWVLLRLSKDLNSQVQVAMTESMQACIKGATVRQALSRERRQYMFDRDLENLKTEIQQRSSFETSWRGFSPVTGSDWRLFRYHYQTVEATNDFIWQLGHNLEIPIAITKPV